MDRIALAKRLESLSGVFANHTPYNRDLKAMSYVLNKMADDKFKTILSGDFSAEDIDSCMCGEGPGPLPGMGGPAVKPVGLPGDEEPKVIVIKKEEEMPMSMEANEKTAGMFWCKEASKAVVDNLLRDVVGMNKSVCCDTGRKLDKEQVPDGHHDGEKAKTLKPEQTPDDAASIDTDMVKKSRGAVKKEAGSIKGPGVPDGTGPMKDSPECKMKKEDKSASSEEKEASLEDIKKAKKEKEDAKAKKDLEDLKKAQKAKKEKSASEEEAEKAEQKAEEKEEKAEEMVEEAEEKLEEAQEKLEEAKEEEKEAEKEEDKDASSSSSFEGIELAASMDEAVLGADEAAQLSKLFE